MRRVARGAGPFLIPVATALLLAGCGGSTAPGPVTTPPSPPPAWTYAPRTVRPPTTPPSTTSIRTSSGVVRGRVYDQDGGPMAGVIVEFKNLSGDNGHTTTRSDGTYALTLPADVYTALALTDQPDSDIGFEVLGGDNSVSVPETTRVDFRAYDIGSR